MVRAPVGHQIAAAREVSKAANIGRPLPDNRFHHLQNTAHIVDIAALGEMGKPPIFQLLVLGKDLQRIGSLHQTALQIGLSRVQGCILLFSHRFFNALPHIGHHHQGKGQREQTYTEVGS